MFRRILAWIDEQTQIVSMIKEFMEEPLAKGVGWPHVFGSAALFLFVIQVATGIFLMLYYSPSPDHAYETVQYINQKLLFGQLVRGLHHWGASGMLLMVGLHMLQTFFWGAYKKPRQIIWVLGVGLLLMTFVMGFTGYLLPWDQKAYWATVVGTNIVGTIPVIGEVFREFIRGGESVGALTLTRFFAVHVYIIPICLAGLAVFHVFQVRRKGITPPGRKAGEEAGVEYASLFFPHQALKDAVVALALLAGCLGLAWYFGAPIEPVANPADTAYVPRPEWYFLWLFQLLKYFPGQWEFVGGVLLPTLAVIALLVFPYLDRNPERSPLRRPFATAVSVAIFIGISILGVMAIVTSPRPRPLTPLEARGQKVFLDLRCNACHGINGPEKLAGPDLGQSEMKDPKTLEEMLRNPAARNPRSIMPVLPPEVGEEEVKSLVAYLISIGTDSRMAEQAPVGPKKPASHIEENWFLNHKFEVLKDPAYCGTCHKSSFCFSCHQKRRPDSHLKDWMKNHGGVAGTRPEYCQVCHAPESRFCEKCHDRLLHTPDWLHRHGSLPAQDRTICVACHRPDFCASCHEGGKPASHVPGWLQAHTKAPKADCQTCHTQDFCSSCHTGARPESHKENWVKRHGKAAKGKASDCAVCHQAQFCSECHGGVEMPHAANFLEGHPKSKQASLAPGSPCFRCHQAVDLCGQCHELPSAPKK